VPSNEPLPKIKAATAAEVCAHFELEPEPRSLLRDAMSPREFLEALLAGKHPRAGIDFIAHALPAREAVWWGCLCLQHATGGDFSALDKAACRAAVEWIMQPTEEHRIAAQATGQEVGLSTPAGQLAMAVNQTGGNIAPPNAPPIPPAPYAPAKAVALAVMLASTKVDPIRIVETQRLFVELGIGVAEGRFK